MEAVDPVVVELEVVELCVEMVDPVEIVETVEEEDVDVEL